MKENNKGNKQHDNRNNYVNKNFPDNVVNSASTKNSLFEEAAKKLKILEKGQKEAERYFKARDITENRLKLLESNLKKKVLLEKKANNTIDEKTLEKITQVLKTISELDSNLLTYFDIPKRSIDSQTEDEDISELNNKIESLQKENENLHTKKIKLKAEIEVLRSELQNLKNNNEKYLKELKNLQVSFEEISSQKSDIEIKFKELQRYNENLTENVKKHDKLIKEYNELKIAMEDSIKIEREQYDFEENRRNITFNEYKNNLMVIPQMDILNEITQFLPIKDISYLLLCCKTIHFSFKNNKECILNYYHNLLKQHKNRIYQLTNVDIKLEYKLSDVEIERLFKEYLTGKKLVGKEIKPLIIKAINFINKEVRSHLGIKVNLNSQKKIRDYNSGNITPKSEAASSILGGIGNFFTGSLFGKQDQSNQTSQPASIINSAKKPLTGPISRGEMTFSNSESKASSRGMSFIAGNADNYSDIDKFDKATLNDLLIQKDELVDFDFNTPDEIRIILNKFLKSDMPTEKLTAFIKEVCLEYSELLFYSFKIVNEIKEIELVKNCLNERFKKLNRICFMLEGELSEYKSSNHNKSNNLTNTKPIQSKNKYIFEIEEQNFKLFNLENKVSMLKMDLEASQRLNQELKSREDKIKAENDMIKTLFTKEIRLLKFDLDEMTKQRDQLKTFIVEFKNQINVI